MRTWWHKENVRRQWNWWVEWRVCGSSVLHSPNFHPKSNEIALFWGDCNNLPVHKPCLFSILPTVRIQRSIWINDSSTALFPGTRTFYKPNSSSHLLRNSAGQQTISDTFKERRYTHQHEISIMYKDVIRAAKTLLELHSMAIQHSRTLEPTMLYENQFWVKCYIVLPFYLYFTRVLNHKGSAVSLFL